MQLEKEQSQIAINACIEQQAFVDSDLQKRKKHLPKFTYRVVLAVIAVASSVGWAEQSEAQRYWSLNHVGLRVALPNLLHFSLAVIAGEEDKLAKTRV